MARAMHPAWQEAGREALNVAPTSPVEPPPQAACLARCNGAQLDLYRYGDCTLEQLRGHIQQVCLHGGPAAGMGGYV